MQNTMKKNIPHINKEELRQLLISEETLTDSLRDDQLHKIGLTVEAYSDYEQVQDLDVDDAWQSIHSRVGAKSVAPKRKNTARVVWLYTLGAVAAVALALLFFYPLLKSPKSDVVIENQIAYTTVVGGEVTLPDGSVVSLNEKSTIRYPKQFVGNERNVELTGEAFFQVKRDTLHPFIIKAADAHVKVLGTSFSVNTLNCNRVEVIVATGKVEVWHSDFAKHVFLTPGRKSIASKESAPVELDADMNEIAWKTGLLKFTNCTLGYITDLLSKTYHKPIVLQNTQLEKLRLTATFDNQPLADILSVVAQTHHLKVKESGDGFVLEAVTLAR